MAMTTAQRRLVVRTLRTWALLIVAAGALFAGWAVWPGGFYSEPASVLSPKLIE